MTLRAVSAVLFFAFGGVVACTTFNGLTATSGLDVPNPDGKRAGAECEEDTDCQSLSCQANQCTAVVGAKPDNGKKDGDESDVDCGGSSAPACEDGKSCNDSEDCESVSCIGGTCKAPSPDDGIKNADETDIDCGGSEAPKCTSGKTCAADSDCLIGGCDYQKKCIDFPSCTPHEGGDTCGAGETGEPGAKHESCCTTVKDGNLSVGKYYVTAGRMRAFVTKHNGDLQKWASTAKNWDSSWTSSLPASMNDALQLLGPGNKRGCSVSDEGQGGRTYWQPPLPDFRSDEKNDFEQKVLDEKMLNCVPWTMAQAICHYDGGRLASAAEVQRFLTNNGATRFPWGDAPAWQLERQSDQAVHFYSYITPGIAPASLRQNDRGDGPLDRAFSIAPPGRRPAGANQAGVMDALGGILPWTNDRPNTFAWTGSWEEHGIMGSNNHARGPQPWPPQNASDANTIRDGYYAIGVRCVFEQ